MRRIPLFPLNTVLFPGGPLRLRIFEPRYLDMVSRCMREDCRLRRRAHRRGPRGGRGGADRRRSARWRASSISSSSSDGLLGITARGERRFRIVHVQQESDGLNVARSSGCDDEARAEVPPQHAVLAELLRRAFEQIGPAYGEVTPAYEDATWVGMRLAEILPLAPVERQELLGAERRTGAAAAGCRRG